MNENKNAAPAINIEVPLNFKDCKAIADKIKADVPVIVQFDNMTPENAKLAMNFLVGCVYALDGSYSKIGSNLYLFAPKNTSVEKKSRISTNDTLKILWND